MTAKIIGTGSAVPAYCMKNNDFTKFIDTSDEWITQRTGIKKRHKEELPKKKQRQVWLVKRQEKHCSRQRQNQKKLI